MCVPRAGTLQAQQLLGAAGNNVAPREKQACIHAHKQAPEAGAELLGNQWHHERRKQWLGGQRALQPSCQIGPRNSEGDSQVGQQSNCELWCAGRRATLRPYVSIGSSSTCGRCSGKEAHRLCGTLCVLPPTCWGRWAGV